MSLLPPAVPVGVPGAPGLPGLGVGEDLDLPDALQEVVDRADLVPSVVPERAARGPELADRAPLAVRVSVTAPLPALPPEVHRPGAHHLPQETLLLRKKQRLREGDLLPGMDPHRGVGRLREVGPLTERQHLLDQEPQEGVFLPEPLELACLPERVHQIGCVQLGRVHPAVRRQSAALSQKSPERRQGRVVQHLVPGHQLVRREGDLALGRSVAERLKPVPEDRLQSR